MVRRSALAGPSVATILALQGRFMWMLRWKAVDDDARKSFTCGQRRAGHDRIAECFEEAVAVVVVQALARLQAQRPGAVERVRSQQRAGDLLLAVDAVGVAASA
jgi:hypothetical protein